MNTDPMIHTASSRRRARRPRPTQLSITSAGATDVGRERATNEDRFLVATLSEGDGRLLAVADGVGGANGGDVASSLAVESIEQRSLPALRALAAQRPREREAILEELDALIVHADQRIAEEAAHHRELEGMATTLTVAAIVDRVLFVTHVGDSRGYLLRHGSLHRVTHDQTVAAELVRRGLLAPDVAKEHRFRHVLTGFAGGGASKLHVERRLLDLAEGDVVLLCSDGLTEMVPDAAITSILVSAASPEDACARLVACANEVGGYDNVTAVVARCARAA